ncbi:1,4-beta-N-acetylmuramidase [Lactobacillus delbrueckii subsp. bulgaricus]|nr:1,4-beta-N-acetylmuramidase [Lactobacillus delbrueckii subsp. bulgaricus]
MGQKKHFQHPATLPALLILLAAIISLLAYGLYNYASQTTLPKGASQSAVGLKVSQADFDLSRLEKGGLSFVYLPVDQNFAASREQVAKTKLAYGSIIEVQGEKNAAKQLSRAKRLAAGHWGALPILLDSGQDDPSAANLTAMSKMAYSLVKSHEIMVNAPVKYKKLFPAGCKFLATSASAPSKLDYCFWRYTEKGHVAGVSGIGCKNVMYAYIGTSQQYKEKYGQLAQ